MTPRLTLRILLDYLDDTLKATEARDVGQQIVESPVVGQLVSRIKRVTYRPRQSPGESVPPGRGEVRSILEANEVAEYLDGTLAGERVADFEKRCLAFDEPLSEVACVHQILSIGVNMQRRIDEETCNRIVAKASTAAPQRSRHAPSAGSVPRQPTPAPARPAAPVKPAPFDLPDYISSGSVNARLFVIFVSAVAALALGFAFWLAH